VDYYHTQFIVHCYVLQCIEDHLHTAGVHLLVGNPSACSAVRIASMAILTVKDPTTPDSIQYIITSNG